MVQFSVELLEKETAPPLDAVAARIKLFVAISTVAIGAKVIVCGSLLTSNETF